MSLRPEPLPPIPDVTAAAVRAAFPKGNLYVDLRTEFGMLYTDQLFVDLYPPEDKRLLQTAAVIGTEVPWPLLQAIADTADEALSRCLAQLQAAEFLYETSLFPERAYTFKHALTQEVAYGSLVQGRRRALHARIVAALEALAGDRRDDQVERLAHHALRGEVWQKADRKSVV